MCRSGYGWLDTSRRECQCHRRYPSSAVGAGDGGQSEAAPMGFTVTAASVGDYRPRLDRRVARSKARPADREVRRKEARERAAMKHPHTHGRRPRSKACTAEKKKEIHRRRGEGGRGSGTKGGTYRNPARNREKTKEQENGQIRRE